MARTNILLESGTNELEIIEFYIDEATEPGVKPYRAYYGVNVAKVLEIIRLPKVTGMPQTPHPCVIGTFNLRSRVIPLIDLSLWLGKPMARDETTKVIVSEFNKVINAFMVSGVTRIHRLSWQEVEPPSGYVASFAANNFTGVVKFPDHIVLLLDMEQIIWDLNPALAMKTERERAAAAIPEPERSAHKTLVVDDSNSIRRLIASYLEKDGFEDHPGHQRSGCLEPAVAVEGGGDQGGKAPVRERQPGGDGYRDAGHGRPYPVQEHQGRSRAQGPAGDPVLLAHQRPALPQGAGGRRRRPGDQARGGYPGRTGTQAHRGPALGD